MNPHDTPDDTGSSRPGSGEEAADLHPDGEAPRPALAVARVALTLSPFLLLAGVFWLLKWVSG